LFICLSSCLFVCLSVTVPPILCVVSCLPVRLSVVVFLACIFQSCCLFIRLSSCLSVFWSVRHFFSFSSAVCLSVSIFMSSL
jgi:hypothetical protein